MKFKNPWEDLYDSQRRIESGPSYSTVCIIRGFILYFVLNFKTIQNGNDKCAQKISVKMLFFCRAFAFQVTKRQYDQKVYSLKINLFIIFYRNVFGFAKKTSNLKIFFKFFL